MDPLTSDAVSRSGHIRTLLVDDNDQWAEFIAGEIETSANDMDITVVLSANEAMIALEESDAVDCIVADYRMPEINGLQLLERIRTEHSDLPFVLITGEGSEAVAATAIDAGVTDYLVKDPSVDQTVLLCNKIETAVKKHRLKRAIEESERRYRTVTEQSRDAIGILQNRRLGFCNRRMSELTGRTADELRAEMFVETTVHADDQTGVRETIDGWIDGTDVPHLHETRIVRPDGTLRYCEVTGRPITHHDERAVLVSIRDITERRQRERELKWERDLNRTTQTALVESRTRTEFERAVADQLREYGYDLVWFAERVGDLLSPRVVAGVTEYIDQLEWSLGETAHDSEPSIWVARRGEATFVQDFETLFATEWRDIALAAGYRSGAGLPLIYNGVSYGVLAVYHARPDRFDEAEQRLLTDLADTAAFAIHSLETENALASDTFVTVTLKVEDDAYYLTALARDGAFGDCEEVSVRGTAPVSDGQTVQFLSTRGGDVDQLWEAIRSHPTVRGVELIADDELSRFEVTVSGPVPEQELASRGAVVRSTRIELEGATVEAEVPKKTAVRPLFEALSETFDSVTVVSVRDRQRTSDSGRAGSPLTEKQSTAVETAYHRGYFERPRRSSATEVAEALGVTHTTFLQHLRAAQQKLFRKRFE